MQDSLADQPRVEGTTCLKLKSATTTTTQWAPCPPRAWVRGSLRMHALIDIPPPPSNIFLQYWQYWFTLIVMWFCPYRNEWAVLLLIVWVAQYNSYPKTMSKSADFFSLYSISHKLVHLYISCMLQPAGSGFGDAHRPCWELPWMCEVVLGQMGYLRP